jgi:hypothetical protein
MPVELDPGCPTLRRFSRSFCIIGPQAPASHALEEGEGATLDIPGVINFNDTDHGDNVYIRL